MAQLRQQGFMKSDVLPQAMARVARFKAWEEATRVHARWSNAPDHTERRHAEETLRVTRAALEFTLEAAQVGGWDLDLVRDTSRRSLRHDRCFGYQQPIPEADWGIEVFVRHVHPDDRQRIDTRLRLAASAHGDFDEEFRVVWPDGSLHWLVARGSIYRNAQGVASRMLGVVMDITDRKRTEEALMASEKLALGHVEALTRTLDSLAAETAPDRLAEHVLRTLLDQLGAQSCSVWRRDAYSGFYDLQCMVEAGRFLTRNSLAVKGVKLRIPMDDFWRERINAGLPCVMEDIAILKDSPWRERLMALGVCTVLMIPMFLGGKVDGTIGIRFTRRRQFRDAEIALAQALANQTMLALQLSRLSEQARATAVTSERNRMARDIHDTLAQGFTGVIVQLEASADAVSRGLTKEADTHIDRAKQLARECLREARRSVQSLRPQALEGNQLPEAIEVLVRTTTAGTPVTAEFTLLGPARRVAEPWDNHLLRIVQEVLTNVLRHARASRFTARVVFEPEALRLEMADDGVGFDPQHKPQGYGLVGIAERVREMAGTLAIATAPGAGVAIAIVLPLAADLGEARQ